MSNSANPSKPFVAVAELGGTQYSVCDRELHSIKLIRQSTGLAIEADSRLQGFQFSSQENITPDDIIGQELYLGTLGQYMYVCGCVSWWYDTNYFFNEIVI